VLGPQWEAVVTPLRILCIYSAYYSCQVLNGHVLLWTGRFRANMWCSIFAAAMLSLGFWFGARWGLVGVAWVWVFGLPLVNLPGFYIAFRALGINGWHWVNAFWPALVACLLMMGAVTVLRSFLPRDLAVPIEFAVSVSVGVVAYAAALLILFRTRLRTVWNFVRILRGDDARLVETPMSA
jgi:O-antigen/teichoic acid export membrane protein